MAVEYPQSTNEKLRDSLLRHQILVAGFATGVVREQVRLLEEARKDIRAQIAGILTELSGESPRPQGIRLSRLRELERDVGERIDSAYMTIGKTTETSLIAFSLAEASFAVSSLNDASPISLGVKIAPDGVINQLISKVPFEGQLLSEWYESLSNTEKERANRAIRMGVVQGESIPEITRRVSDGLRMGQRQSSAIARTAVHHVTTRAKEAVYERNIDILRGVQMVATLDGRTTPFCRRIDGKVFAPKVGARPPFHFQCRTTTIPVVKKLSELGIRGAPTTDLVSLRSSLNGYVASDTTYKQWFKTQSSSFQKEVLGRSRYKLYRRGLTDITRYADRRGRLYTLDQLYQREREFSLN